MPGNCADTRKSPRGDTKTLEVDTFIMAFAVFDHMGHAAKCPPTQGAGDYLLELDARRELRITFPMRQDKRDKLLITVSTPIREWLDTLPEGATVSGGQVLEAFCGMEKGE